MPPCCRTGAWCRLSPATGKEATGLRDETQITAVRDRLLQLGELDKRRQEIIASLSERELLDQELHQALLAAPNLTILEDLYLPHRPKRRTRSIIAMEKGLEPLARARDIIAEWINEDPAARGGLRQLFAGKGVIISRGGQKEPGGGQQIPGLFRMAGTGSQGAEPSVARHAARRKRKGADSGGAPPPKRRPASCCRYVKGSSVAAGQVNLAVQDSYKRLLAPSLENELRTHLKEQADREAIKVFVDNLRGLLLASPLGRKRVMALDPGFRTGAKLVCLDGQGGIPRP